MSHEQKQSIKVGIVANEFFDQAVGRMGGFGWLAREAAICFKQNTNQEVEPVFLTGELRSWTGEKATVSHGVPLVYAQDNWEDYVLTLQSYKIDVLLTIDYRPDYDFPIAALPDKPLIVWIQDPRPIEDVNKVNSLKIPGQQSSDLEGIDPIDCTPLVEAVNRSKASGRKIIFTSPAPQLIDKVKGTYGLTLSLSEMKFLPYPLNIDSGEISKSDHARVIFLGRLDPIKRPWVFTELARLFPEVEFCLLGKSHFQGKGAWNPSDVPGNVKFLGHIDGEEKRRMLSSAWILINTSIHEALPVSFLEALLYEMPIISCQNPEEIVSRFGFYTGRFDDDGLESLPEFAKGLSKLLEDESLRKRLGKEGRQWVDANHSQKKFVSIFYELFKQAKIGENERIEQSRIIPEPWGIPEWSDGCYQAVEGIKKLISSDEMFILVDDNQLIAKLNGHHKAVPFIEKNGLYFGPPESNREAIDALERLRQAGAKYLVFAWQAFWWLDYYAEFNSYLRSNFPCILESERLIVFGLGN
jgi:glycosyltransferase involved in cell wall biosynthesis